MGLLSARTRDDVRSLPRVQILEEPKSALTKQYQRFFGYDNIELVFTDNAMCVTKCVITKETISQGIRPTLVTSAAGESDEPVGQTA